MKRVQITNSHGVSVNANIYNRISVKSKRDYNEKWLPMIIFLTNNCGCNIQTFQWNGPMPHYKGDDFFKISLKCNYDTEGFMIAAEEPYNSHGPFSSDLLKIWNIESAPWNNSKLGNERRFRGVGTRLIEYAIQISKYNKIGLETSNPNFFLRCQLLSLRGYNGGMAVFES